MIRGLPELQTLMRRVGRKANTIFYLVPHPDQNLADASPFQGFTPDLLESAPLYAQVATLPLCVHELLFDNEGTLTFRMWGEPYAILPVPITSLAEALDWLRPFYCCIWSANDEIAQLVEAFIKGQLNPILHVSSTGSGDSLARRRVNREHIRGYVASVLEYHERLAGSDDVLRGLREAVMIGGEVRPIASGLRLHNHLLTNPNEMALQAVGFTFTEVEGHRLIGTDNQPYFDATRELVELMGRARDVGKASNPFGSQPVPYELILTAPSLLKSWRNMRRLLSHNLPAEKRKRLRFFLKELIGRGTYGIAGDASLIRSALEDEDVNFILAANRQDLGAYTAALTVLASSNVVPVIRLPTAVNNTIGEAIQLENTARAEGPIPRRGRKLSKLARQLSLRLGENIPPWVVDRLSKAEGVKLISDAPLEWLNVEGFPLALRADVSRIPTTPGNLFFMQSVIVPPVTLTPDNFDEILIIRAFSYDDPVRNVMMDAIESYRERFPNGRPEIRYVDVESREDILRAFDSFRGAVAVFDGHGRHPSGDDIGLLTLPKGHVVAWELSRDIRVPPIMFLSSCDTHPMSASHATTANGFLAAGAKTVIATSLPVDASASAQFVGRLLYRISKLMPSLLEKKVTPLRWSRLVTSVQRCQYINEVLDTISRELMREGNDAALRKAVSEAGRMIDSDRSDWLEAFIASLSAASTKSIDDVKSLIENEAYITDALLHIQLGNPEHVSISG